MDKGIVFGEMSGLWLQTDHGSFFVSDLNCVQL